MTGCLSPGGWCLAGLGGSGQYETTGFTHRRDSEGGAGPEPSLF